MVIQARNDDIWTRAAATVRGFPQGNGLAGPLAVGREAEEERMTQPS